MTYDLPTAEPTAKKASASSSQEPLRRFASPLHRYTHGLVNLRSGPGTSYGKVGEVAAGTSLKVLGQSGDWYLIRRNGREVYIANWLTFDAPPQQVSRQQPEQQAPQQQQPIQEQPVQQQPSFTCNCSKTCGEMSSCREAYFQLNDCGCRRRDGNNDGVPCESICR